VHSPRRCGPSPQVLRCRGSGGSRTGVVGFPRLAAPPINWGQVEDSVEHAFSQVTAMDRLLRGVLAMVDQDIMHPIRISLKKKNSLPEFL
jgi:hypothetical protein